MKISWSKAVRFIFENFAVPIVFFTTFHTLGPKPAIAFAVGAATLQLLVHAFTRTWPTPFFLVAAGFTVVFGGMDLVVPTPRFYRLEPAFQNYVVGAAFLVSLILRRPILEWFARALPEAVRPRLDAAEHAYLRRVTAVWTAYFFGKASFFLYLAFRVDLGTLVLVRSIVGGGSLALLVAGEIAYRKLFRDRRENRR